MAKPVWPGQRTTNPTIRARAFGAIGVLTAANWKPGDGDYGDVLTGIVNAGTGPIAWQHPSSNVNIAGTPFDEDHLAKAWDRAFVGGGNPFARLTIDTQSLAQGGMTLQEGIVDTYHALITPWMRRIDDGKPGQIAALSFATFDHADPHDWNWPIRVGVPRRPDLALSDRLNAIRGVRRDFIEFVSPDKALSDVMLLSEDEFGRLSRSARMSPGLSIVYMSSSDAPMGMVAEINENISTPTAMIAIGERSLPRFLNEFGDEIAHNKPLDVAMFDAYRTLYGREGIRSDNAAPLLLLAPRTNQQIAFDGVRVENRVRELRDRLNRLPGNVFIDTYPDAARHIGISRSFRTIDQVRRGISNAIENNQLNFDREIFGGKGLRSTAKVIDALEEKLSTHEPAPAPDSQPFSAFPRLDMPSAVAAEESFEIEVGFSDVADPTQPNQEKITISDAHEDEEMFVVVAAIKGTVIGPNPMPLKLKLDSTAKFTIQPAAGCDFVSITATYLFRNQSVGSIGGQVGIIGQPAPPPIPEKFRQIINAVVLADLDLMLIVLREDATKIRWIATKDRNRPVSIPVEIGDARQFASQLDQNQRNFEYQGFGGHSAVRSIGATIANKIPEAIQRDYLAPLLKADMPPRILLLTNEPYIPWELALLDPEITGKEDLEYFGALARIGRWWIEDAIGAPAPTVRVQKMTVVAADQYLDQNQLPEATAERNWLSDKFKSIPAVPVLGNLQPVIDWLKSLPVGPGHLAHFALHGYSNPVANEQVLMLGDGRNVDPGLLSGVRRKSDKIPRYEMVFLNCCQVGVSGVTLGQFAGFPGKLLEVGTNAVIGPIWEINDAAAHLLVQDFYNSTFDRRIPVSEALRQIRANRDPDKTTTPLAYIFYGHPDLTLSE